MSDALIKARTKFGEIINDPSVDDREMTQRHGTDKTEERTKIKTKTKTRNGQRQR